MNRSLLLTICCLLAVSFVVFAQTATVEDKTGGEAKLTNPLGGCDFKCVAEKIIGGLFNISIPIAGIMIVIGGFQIFTAGGKPEQLEKGKKTITYAVVGFVVILLAESIIVIIRNLGG